MRALLVFAFFLVYALFVRWYYVCEYLGLCDEKAPVIEDVRLKTLSLTENDSIIYAGFDQFAFDTMSVRPRLNANNNLFLDTLAALLKANPSKKLKITSFFRASEKGEEYGIYENLGLARAAEVRKLLMRRGIDENRIAIDHGVSEDEQLREPMLFETYVTPDEFQFEQFSFTQMTFSDANFAFNSDVFEPGDAFKFYADSVKTHLELNPGTTLTIIGHTDNIDSEKFNYNLGMRRAKNARQYFLDMGISSEINVDSKGELEPVASNQNTDGSDNPEGRQRNRRVVFLLEPAADNQQ
jgi:outer membrane protein OmpA-like peptidoglycan-associated protein